MAHPNDSGFDYEGLSNKGTNIDFGTERNGRFLFHEDKARGQSLDFGQWQFYVSLLWLNSEKVSLILLSYPTGNNRSVYNFWYYHGNMIYKYDSTGDEGRDVLEAVRNLWWEYACKRELGPTGNDLNELGLKKIRPDSQHPLLVANTPISI